MRVLSVRQPWASLIGSGRKSIELRSWSTGYRGPVLIIAGSQPWRGSHGYTLGPLGVAICIVDLVDVRPAMEADAGAACLSPPAAHMAWILERPRLVAPSPIRGRLGLYTPDAALCGILGM